MTKVKLVFAFAMGLVVLASNELVQHPIQLTILGIQLSGLLTWGALSYPVAFLVTDTTNKLFGVKAARQVVSFGFILGVSLTVATALGISVNVSRLEGGSMWQALFHDPDAFATLRIALASGSAFLIAQLLDIKVFDVLRRHAWWKAPLASSLVGSFVDTLVFFFLAFAGTGLPWASWAAGDFCAKLVMIALLLYPFRLLVRWYPQPLQTAP